MPSPAKRVAKKNATASVKPKPKPKRVAKPRKSTARADRVREVILAVALESFSAQGFSGTSTRSIAKLAGTRHSLVNYHFETKEKLWTAMMEAALGEHMKHVAEVFEKVKNESAADRLRAYIEVYAKMAAAKPEVFRILTQQSTQNSARLNWLIETYLKEHFPRLIALIAEAQKSGAVIPGRPEHIYYLIVSSVGIFYVLPREYAALTGKDVFSAAEMHHIKNFVCSVIFTNKK